MTKRTIPAEKPTGMRKLDSAVKSLLAITENQKRDLAAGKAQFEKLQAHADKLAEALRKIERRTNGSDGTNQHPNGAIRSIGTMAKQALAAYESEVQQ